MHRYKTLILLVFAVVLLAACKKGPRPPRPNFNLPISTSKPAKGDHAIYGLACMGCTDSVVVLLPNSGGDPVRYNILEATRQHQVFGDIEIGDWICVLPVEGEKNRARMVVDLDKLKATWTYQVMPHLRDLSHLSRRQQARIARQHRGKLYGATRIWFHTQADGRGPIGGLCHAEQFGGG